MTKLKQMQLKVKILGIALLLVAVTGIGLAVNAYVGSSAPKVVVEGDYIEAQEVSQENEPTFGAVSNPDILSTYLSVNGDTTYHITGSFQEGTTTIVAFPSPFLMATTSATDVVIDGTTNSGFGYTSATTTVDLVRLDVSGAATSTYSVTCGASNTNGKNGAAGIDTSLLATAANGVATSTKGILENNLTAALGGIADAGTVEKITLNQQYPYFTCLVTSVYPGAFTEATNTFDGKFTVHLHKQR